MASEVASQNNVLTVADICQAISTRELPAERLGPWYVIQRRDVEAFATRQGSRQRLADPRMAS